MKNLKAIFLVVVLSFPVISFANPDSDGDIPSLSDFQEKAKKKVETDPLHGFSVNLGLSSNHRLNLEPDNAEWIASYSINAGWKLGKVLFSGNSWLKKLSLSGAFNFSNEIVGNNPKYRSAQFADPNLYSGTMSYLGVTDSFLSDKDAEDVDRRVSGAEKRMDYSDIAITLSHPSLFKLPAKFNLSGSVGFLIPVSYTSRNVGLKTKLDNSLGLSKSFKVGGKSVSFSYGLTFTYYFYDYTTSTIQSLDQDVIINGQSVDTYHRDSVSRNNEFGFTNMVSLGFSPIKKMRLAASYGILTLRTYKYEDCLYTAPGGEVIDLCANTNEVRGYDDGGRGRRDYQMFSLNASYSLLDYLSLSVALNTFTPQLKPNAQDYQQPFISFNRNNYSSLMVKLSYSLDSFYKSLNKAK